MYLYMSIANAGLSQSSFSIPQNPTSIDAFGRLRTSTPYTLFDSQQRYSLDTSFTSNTLNGGSVTFSTNQSTANLVVTTTTGSFAARESNYVFTYQPGKSLLVMCSFVMSQASSGLVQRVGYFGTQNGIYLELSDKLYFVRRSYSLGAVSNTMVDQTQWSGDKLFGYPLDITKSQIFWCDLEWLGVGNVRCGFVLNGQFVLCHTFQAANYLSYAYMTTANLPIRYEITNNGSSSGNLLQICSTVMSEAGYDQSSTFYSQPNLFTATMTANTWYPVTAIRLLNTRLDSVVQITSADISVTTSQVVVWGLWYNVNSNALNGTWSSHSSSTLVQLNTTATTFSTTGCIQVASGLIVGSSGNGNKTTLSTQLSKFLVQIGRNSFTQTSDIFVLALMILTPASASVSAQSILSWAEKI
jgi:hypothetical protein